MTKHCIDFKCVLFSGERQEKTRDREEGIDTKGSWLHESKSGESKTESN